MRPGTLAVEGCVFIERMGRVARVKNNGSDGVKQLLVWIPAGRR